MSRTKNEILIEQLVSTAEDLGVAKFKAHQLELQADHARSGVDLNIALKKDHDDLCAKISRLQEEKRKAEPTLVEFYRSAEELLRLLSKEGPSARLRKPIADARLRMEAAMNAASNHIDLIPF